MMCVSLNCSDFDLIVSFYCSDLMKATNDRNMSRMEKELEKTSKSMDDLSKELLTIAAEHQRVKEKMDQDYRRCQTEEESQRVNY